MLYHLRPLEKFIKNTNQFSYYDKTMLDLSESDKQYTVFTTAQLYGKHIVRGTI